MNEHNIREMATDVLVIGASAGGLPAAVRAKESGAGKVIVIDKTRQMGGCARLAAGMFAVESPAQKRLGIHVTADDCFTEHMERQNWHCDARLVRKWMRNSGDLVRWIESKGMQFNDVSEFNVYGAKKVYHSVIIKAGAQGGNEIVNTLIKECNRQGVEMFRETRATRLLTSEKGDVIGALATRGDSELKIFAKSVVVATGSIAGNRELIKRFYPYDDHEHTKFMTAVAHNTGDGLLMCEEAGAENTPVASLRIGPHNHPNNIRVGLVIRRPHPMTVNKFGERFTDETLFATHPFSWFAGESLDVQPEKVCFPIYDQKILKDMVAREVNYYGLEEGQGRIKAGTDMTMSYGTETGVELEDVSQYEWLGRVEDDIRSEAAKGRVHVANTLEEIAAWIGCDPVTLKETVARYNDFCKHGYDDDFLKKKEFLLPISTPPYYVFRAHQGIDTCIGGIRIDHNQRVIHKNTMPIKGLFAAGVCTGGWLNNGYSYPGSCLGYSLYSGYAAGANAAAYAMGQKE